MEEEMAKSSNILKFRLQYNRIVNKRTLVPVEHLTAWLIKPNKLFVFWKLLDMKKELVTCYFNRLFQSYPQVLMIYNVTNSGIPADCVREVLLEEGQEELLLTELQPNNSYGIELGIKVSSQTFFPLLRSSTVLIPSSNTGNGTKKRKVDHVKSNDLVPDWLEHVSTYSYYDK